MASGCILHGNAEDTVIVIDLPRSIAEAQERRDDAELLSCIPMTNPLQRQEQGPSAARRARDAAAPSGQTPPDLLNAAKCEKLLAALQYLKTTFPSSSYCLPRNVRAHASRMQFQDPDGITMNIDIPDLESGRENPEGVLRNVLSELASGESTSVGREVTVISQFTYPNEFMNTTSRHTDNDAANASWDNFVHNESHHSKDLVMTVSAGVDYPGRFIFNLPPRSAFLLGKCERSSSFRAVAREYSASLNPSRGRFDLIVLDPPWPNRSARRKGSYQEASNKVAIESILLGLDLDAHIAPDGYVAIWITNRPAIRELVLGEDGLFDVWNVILVEEWTWLKVTQNGEPMLPLDASFRRPYETLLIGRSPHNRLESMQPLPLEDIVHKTIVGVPDLHSRKPCLKTVFERCLLDNAGSAYMGLEIFARYTVAGWMSWGDEAIKYNCDAFWTRQPLSLPA